MKPMKIGEVARLSGVGIETIRFYEREGLLRKPDRRPSGYRQYDAATVNRLEYIRKAKNLGFTLVEIRELLELSSTESNCEHIQQRADAKITDIQSKIHSLQQMKRALSKIVQRCRAGNSSDNCPLIHNPNKGPGE